MGYGGGGIYIELENEVLDDLFFNNQKLIESDAICPGCDGVTGKENVQVKAGTILFFFFF